MTTTALPPENKAKSHIAAKIAAVEIYENICAMLQEDKTPHVASVFAVCGSLAGQACLQAALQTCSDSNNTLITVSDVAGRHYYYGDPIDRLLLEDRLSIRALLDFSLQKFADATMPDIGGILYHVTQTIGAPQFGAPRLPLGHEIHITPLESLQLWQPLKAGILDRLHVPTQEWHLAYGLAIQKMLVQESLSPSIAAHIVMECAVPMSKVKTLEFQ